MVTIKVDLMVATHDDDTGRSTYSNIVKEYGSFCTLQNVVVMYNTRGPIETCCICLNESKIQGGFWVLDNDILYDTSIDWMQTMNPNELYILVQHMSEDEKRNLVKGGYSPFGHITVDDTGRVTDVVEKVYTSDLIVLGAYGFGSTYIYNKLFDKFKSRSDLVCGEWFMSILVKLAIENGIIVNAIESTRSVAIGTPEQVQQVLEHGIVKPKPLRWVFDLDETLVSLPERTGDYTSVRPIHKVVNFVKHLYQEGHYIIIHTARHMKTCNNDVDLVQQRIGSTTEETLLRFEIPYHELVYGKPYADVYVDDRSTNPCQWEGKWCTSSLGFGWDSHIKEEISIKKIIRVNDTTCMKVAALEEGRGNLFFYNNCPSRLKEHIPEIYGSVEKDNKVHIIMEWKYDCIPLGKMYAFDMMTPDIFSKVLDLLHTVQESTSTLTSASVLSHVSDNYLTKFLLRKEAFHDIYKNFKINMRALEDFFLEYHPKVVECIHGDFWFSNLLWSHKDSKIYMIDMRGRLGNEYTTAGDRNYDLAKLRQSIEGFDKLIQKGSRPANESRAKLLRMMQDNFGLSDKEMEENGKLAAFLMLGSVPFHPELRKNFTAVQEVIVDLWPSILFQ